VVAAILVLALGGGDSEGSDLVSVLTSSITGFIPKFIALAVAYLVARGIYAVFISGAGFNALGLVHPIAVLFASGILIILTVACLKKAS
jgi:hypothetical protein